MPRFSVALFAFLSVATSSLLDEKDQNHTVVTRDETDRDSYSSSPETVPVEETTKSQQLRRRKKAVSFAPEPILNATARPAAIIDSIIKEDETLEPLVSSPRKADNETVEEKMRKLVPAFQRYYGDDDYIPYFDDSGDTGRELFDDELPIYGDASLMLQVEGKNVIMTGSDAAKLGLVTLGSFIALYGWTLFTIWLYKYYTS